MNTTANPPRPTLYITIQTKTINQPAAIKSVFYSIESPPLPKLGERYIRGERATLLYQALAGHVNRPSLATAFIARAARAHLTKMGDWASLELVRDQGEVIRPYLGLDVKPEKQNQALPLTNPYYGDVRRMLDSRGDD